MTRRATILAAVVFICVGLGTLISATHGLQPEAALAQQPARREADRSPAPPGMDVADEIFRIRDEVDLDIFAGTTLDRDENPGNSTAKGDVFQSKLVDLLHRPPPPTEDAAAPTRDGPQLVASVAKLRDVSARIDRVAHRLELQRQYHDADDMRGIAQEVRVVARGLDGQSMPDADVGNGARLTR